MTLEMRFWEKFDRRGDLECWPWLGVTVKGYGIFWVDSKRRAARVPLSPRQLRAGPAAPAFRRQTCAAAPAPATRGPEGRP